MVRVCVKEGWWACFEKSIGVWSKGKEELQTTEEDMENASGEEEQECWFEGGCIESSEMESGNWRDCYQSGVNLATPVYRDKPRSKLELKNWIEFRFGWKTALQVKLKINSVLKHFLPKIPIEKLQMLIPTCIGLLLWVSSVAERYQNIFSPYVGYKNCRVLLVLLVTSKPSPSLNSLFLLKRNSAQLGD